MNQKIIISLISLAVGLALVFVFIDPFWSSIKVLKVELTKQEETIVKLEELLTKTQGLKESYQEFEEEAQDIFWALPQEEDIPHLLVQFDNLVSNNGLLLETVSFDQINQKTAGDSGQSEKTMADFSKLMVEMKMSGSYEALKGFLAALESNIRSMDVNSINFSAQRAAGDLSANLGIFDFDLIVNVYYLK